jgi:hypothetical protein
MNDLGLEQKPRSEVIDRSNYEKCYSAEEIVNIYQLSKDSISKIDLQSLSPSLMYLRAKDLCVTSPESERLAKNLAVSQEARSTNAESMIFHFV